MTQQKARNSFVLRIVLAFGVGGLMMTFGLSALEYRRANDVARNQTSRQVLETSRKLQETLLPFLDNNQHDSVQDVIDIYAGNPRVIALRLRYDESQTYTAGSWPKDLSTAAVWTVNESGTNTYGQLDLGRPTVLAVLFEHDDHHCLIETLVNGKYIQTAIRRHAIERLAGLWIVLAVLALFGLLMLRRWFSVPMSRLLRLASDDAEAESFEKFGSDTGGEFGQLAGALAHMLRKIDTVTDELRAREHAMEDLFQSAPSALLSVGSDGRVCDANNSAALLFGVKDPGALIGRAILDFIVKRDRGSFRQSIDRLGLDRSTRCEMQFTVAGSKTIDVAAQFNGLYSRDDQLERVRIALADISESKRLLREITEHKQLIDLVINHMSDAILLVSNEDHKVLTVNRRLAMLLSSTPDLLMGTRYDPSDFWRTLGPIDDDLFRSRLGYALANPDQTHHERFEGRNGSFQFRIVPVQNLSDQPLAQLWVVQDVTAEVRSRFLFKLQERQLRTLQMMGESLHDALDFDDLLNTTVGTLPEMMGIEIAGLAIRHDGRADRCKQAFNATSDSTPIPAGGDLADVVRNNLMPSILEHRDTSHWTDLASHGPWTEPFRRLGIDSLAATVLTGRNHTQGVLWIARRGGMPIEDHHLFLLEALAPMLATALQNVSYASRMRQLKLIDSITGLPCFDQFPAIASEMTRQPGPWATLMLDIDRCFDIHRHHGKEAVHAVLRAIGEIIRDSSRVTDHTLRFAEDRFVVLCPGASREPAMNLGERIRKRVEALTFQGNEALKITCSIGIVVSPGDSADPQELVELAESRVQQAKSAGRNTVWA